MAGSHTGGWDAIVHPMRNVHGWFSVRPSTAIYAMAALAGFTTLTSAAAALAPGTARAQQRDTTRADSAAHTLDQVRVTVTRSPISAQRAPWAVDVLEKDAIAGGRATLGIDEALNDIPGVIVSNRYNASVDQRLSIRGAGSRATFSLRGVKVLLDGVPQSLPDGQNQLTNVDLGAVSRVEVLRGSASSLYGNGSGGVIAFETDRSAPDRLGITTRLMGGSFGMSKFSARAAGRTDRATASLSVSRTRSDGPRMYDTSEVRQSIATLDYALTPMRTLELRASFADSPVARNPGALTAAEYAVNRDSASAFNIARGANKWLSQGQYSARVRNTRDNGEQSVVAYVQRRFIDNPLAAPPPGTGGPTIGTFSTLNRWVTGARADLSRWTHDNPDRRRLNVGVDVQRSFDIRRNSRATGGVRTAPTDTLVLHQGESVIALGAFASSQWSPVSPLTVSLGTRIDRLTFDVSDNFLADGVDNSANRVMRATSFHSGASWVAGPRATWYANVSTAFETPTTTELAARQDGAGGFNPDLDPQRILTLEGGVRGDFGSRVRYSMTAFRTTYDDAIVQFLETTGRAFFRNAGQTRNTGLELGARATLTSWLDASLAWTESRYRFVRYRIPNRTVVDTLDGKRLAGVPDRFVRLGLRARSGAFTIDMDHTWSGDMFGDDRNTLKVDSWGTGALNMRLAWAGDVGRTRIAPFVAVNNVLDEAYVGSVTLNGAAGRVLEPAPLRNFHVGVETGWRVVRE